MESRVATDIRQFIISTFLFGDEARMPTDTDSLLETGTIDSTGILELIEFLESEYLFSVADSETVPENLGSVANLVRYVGEKAGQAADVS